MVVKIDVTCGGLYIRDGAPCQGCADCDYVAAGKRARKLAEERLGANTHLTQHYELPEEAVVRWRKRALAAERRSRRYSVLRDVVVLSAPDLLVEADRRFQAAEGAQ